jgi:thiamine-monophosphate kinase
MENTERTELSELGEFGLIKHLTKNNQLKQETTVLAVGDDAAVIQPEEGNQLVITTDMLLEGVHFDLTYVPLRHLGYKAAIVNFSDICAMNALPKQITVSVGLSNRFSVEAIEELYEGIYLACSRYNVDLIGGDTTSSKSGLVISVTCVGQAKPENIVKRSTAKDKDLIVVSGDLGGAYVGLQLLEREKAVYLTTPGVQPDLEGNDYILERQLKPEARVDVVQMLKDLDVLPTSMIDISDGLSSELLHLCHASDTGCVLYEEKVPIDPTTYNIAREFNLDPTVCALSGGEDYELLFTISLNDFEKIKGNPHFSVIGHMTPSSAGYNMISKSNTQHPITAQGWNALKPTSPRES